jgi:hypothetical protein
MRKLSGEVVTRTDRLDILRACEGFHRIPGLPSWAPDWNCNVFRNDKAPVLQTEPYDLSSEPSPVQPVARFLDVPLTITVRGFVMGYLVGSGQILFKLPDRTNTHQFQEASSGYMDFTMKYLVPNLGFCAKSAIRLLSNSTQNSMHA